MDRKMSLTAASFCATARSLNDSGNRRRIDPLTHANVVRSLLQSGCFGDISHLAVQLRQGVQHIGYPGVRFVKDALQDIQSSFQNIGGLSIFLAQQMELPQSDQDLTLSQAA